MLLLLLALLQTPAPRISRVVIVGAVLAFVAGVYFLVYFYRRYKRSEKDPELKLEVVKRLSNMRNNKEAQDYMMELLNK